MAEAGKKKTKTSSKKTGKAASKKPSKKTAKKTRRKKAEPASRGFSPEEVSSEGTAVVDELAALIDGDGGSVLARYRDPLGGHPTLLAALPLDRVEPTPFQRDLSATHVKRLTDVIDKLDRFLDPVIVVRTDEGQYWTPNGNHRLNAMKALGAKSIIGLVVPDASVAYKILALNTEKAHNVKEKSLEVIRMARSLAELDDAPEERYALEFEEPMLLTLGACYERKGRFSGSAYSPVLKRVEAFFDRPLSEALEVREARAGALLELDEAVGNAVQALKDRGFDSPYLKTFVIARINPLRFKRSETPSFDEVLEKMTEAAGRFDASKVRADQISSGSGPAASED